MIWSPIVMQRADGSRYALFLHFQIVTAPGFSQKRVMGGVEHSDGRMEPFVDLVPELTYHPENRRLQGGFVHATMADGSSRSFEFEVVSDTGVHLGAGLYFGFDGHHHGDWRGELNVEGERIADCSDPDQARRLHQIRDTAVRVLNPVGGGAGFGNCQPIITGTHPHRGLTADTSLM